jgi:hypothetical protein
VVGFARFGHDMRVLLARYTADGALDRSFSGGLVLTRLDGSFDDAAASLLRLPDGRVVVAGSDTSNASEHGYLLIRYGQPLLNRIVLP